MIWRGTYKTNDIWSIIGLFSIIIFFSIGMFFSFGSWLQNGEIGVFKIILTSILGIWVLSSFIMLLLGVEYELIVSNKEICWGRTKSRKKKKITITDIDKLVYDIGPEEAPSFFILKDGKKINLPGHILFRKNNNKEFINTIKEHFDNIDVLHIDNYSESQINMLEK